MVEHQEQSADDGPAARAQATALALTPADVVVGVAASGRTPYTIAAVETARAAGALTIGIANNPDTPLPAAAHHGIVIATGTEVIAGSTRMKAGTAQKIVLNLLTTAIMLRLGRVHDGLMVDMVVSNDKLHARAVRMVARLAGVEEAQARTALAAAGDRDIKAAVLIAGGLSADEATARLTANGGILRDALERGG